MKKIWIGIIITVVVALCIVLITTKIKKEPREMKIGALLPLTGDLAKFGVSFKKGIDLAFSEDSTHSNKIKIIYEDDQGKPDVAVSAFKKLINFNKTQIVIGGAISSNAMAMGPIADKNKIVLLSPTATAPELTKFKYFFRVQPSDFLEGKIMANFAFDELNRPNIAVAYVNNDWGKGLSGVFISEYNQLKGSIIAVEYFERNSNDFRTIISKIKIKNPQFVYLLGYLSELLNFLTQAAELGLNTKYLSAFSFYDSEILKNIPSNIIEGSYVSAPLYDPESKEQIVNKFVQKYKDKYDQIPDMFAAHAYDCAILALKAINEGNRSGEAIAKYIQKLQMFNGVTGNMRFINGDVVKPYRIFIIKNRKYEYLKTINPL